MITECSFIRLFGQEDKEAMFDSYDTICNLVRIAAGVVDTLKVDKKAMENALSYDLLATDIAYYLVRKGVSTAEMKL